MNITKIEKSVTEMGDRVRPGINAAKRRLGSLNGQTTKLVKDHPALSLLAAAALGYLVARVARWRS